MWVAADCAMTGRHVLCTGCRLDTSSQWLAVLEPVSSIQWQRCWRQDTEVVVGCEQLEDTRRRKLKTKERDETSMRGEHNFSGSLAM